MSSRSLWLLLGLLSLTSGCDSKKNAPAAELKAAEPKAAEPKAAEPKAAEPKAAIETSAQVGKTAPDFTLPDLDGKQVKLADYRGKVVVLEWFNPGCPFVRAAHTSGSLVDTASRAEKNGVIWLAINSGAPGKQGHGVEASRAGRDQFGMTHPILIDESGQVGRAYGAARTPHLYVIDEDGVLVYAGAVDNSPDGEGKSPEGGALVSYVEQALSELAADEPITIAKTKAYGCSVKY